MFEKYNTSFVKGTNVNELKLLTFWCLLSKISGRMITISQILAKHNTIMSVAYSLYNVQSGYELPSIDTAEILFE